MKAHGDEATKRSLKTMETESSFSQQLFAGAIELLSNTEQRCKDVEFSSKNFQHVSTEVIDNGHVKNHKVL